MSTVPTRSYIRTEPLLLEAEKSYWQTRDQIWASVPCRIWPGARNESGYGVLRINNRVYLMHRLLLGRVQGVLESEVCALHHCDTPACYELLHLFSGSVTDNNLDRHSKGRSNGGSLLGERNPAVKFTDAQIVDIRAAQGTVRDIAARYHISVPYLIDIRKYRARS